jgi:hypothetical protein
VAISKFIIFSTVLLLVGYFTACKQNNTSIYIISQHNRTKNLNRQQNLFYGTYNFILDTSGELYFHNKDSLLNCCSTGANYNYPDYIGLKPADMKIISDNDLEIFLDSVINISKKAEYSIQIAVFSDTIEHKTFFQLLEKIQDRKLEIYNVRLATEEETEVLKAKKQNRNYDFYKVKWKSSFSNMVFPPPPPKEP